MTGRNPRIRFQRSFRRRCLLTLVPLALGLVLIEGASAIAFRWLVGESFSFEGVADQQILVAIGAGDAGAEVGTVGRNSGDNIDLDAEAGIPNASETRLQWHGSDASTRGALLEQLTSLYRTPHPYLGFVYSTELNADRFKRFHRHAKVSRFGFIDDELPLKKRSDDEVIVAIMGGSVALEFAGDRGVETLAREMRQHPLYRGREITFVCLGLSGFKQPQQLMALTYLLALGGEFDIVLNIDGFNEIALPPVENLPAGAHPFYPRGWQSMVDSFPNPMQQRLQGKKAHLEKERMGWARTFLGLPTKYSVTLQLIWAVSDLGYQEKIAKTALELDRSETVKHTFVSSGPDIEGFIDENIPARLAEFWKDASIQMHRLCKQNDIQYLHFLQPSQYVRGSKRLSRFERRHAVSADSPYAPWVKRGYPELVTRGESLRTAGVDFHDLTQLFADYRKTLYIDDLCHLNAKGSMIMGSRIAKAVGAAADRKIALDLRKKRLIDLICTPAVLTIKDPFEPVQLEVVGTFGTGSTRRLELASLGTEYVSSDASTVSVSSDGLATGLRNGEVVVAVKSAGLETQVKIRVVLERLMIHGDGLVGSGGLTPMLDTDGELPTLGNKGFKLRLSDVVGGGEGYLLLSPYPDTRGHQGLYVPLEGRGYPLRCDGETGEPGAGGLTVTVPLPDASDLRGKSIFCQVLIRDEGAALGWSASNGLYLTVE